MLGQQHVGQLGDGTTTNRSVPVSVVGLSGPVTAVAAGVNHTCAVTAAGGAVCWGSNSGGQLGDGTGVDRLTPVNVAGLTVGVASVASGYRYSCALLTNGGVKCWGLNFMGSLATARW